ncbi:hypothetical protein BASA81_002803 [Batrachochytrium salamandrivorans]|nr:hypothetical protein BASA81_002803 [Batrachochytrium salamandrivorans]
MEAMEAIFGEEYEKLSPSSFKVTITPNCEPPFYISCVLEWTLPTAYPDVAPALAIQNVKGLNDLWNQELQSKLVQEAVDNLLGSAMIFSLVDLAREWLTERNVAGLGEDSMHSKMLRAQYAKQMETEAAQAAQVGNNQGGVSKIKSAESVARKAKEAGTAVNPETFAKWMQHCLQREEGQAKLALGGKQARLTGRQIYEQGGKSMVDPTATAGAEGEEGLEDFDPRQLQQDDSEEEEDEDGEESE